MTEREATPALDEIGAALAATGRGASVTLTDEQRAVLLESTSGDVLDAIIRSIGSTRRSTSTLRSIAQAWEAGVRAAFGDEQTQSRVANALASDDPKGQLIELVLSDDRLSVSDRDEIAAELRSIDAAPQIRDGMHDRVVIQSIEVEGFRGVGPKAKLPIDAGPGVTLIYGANGSGKSSFVEALDVLLTGTTGRFEGHGPEWVSAWHNIHTPGGGSVQATFTPATGSGDHVTLRRRWTGDRFITGTYEESPSQQIADLGWLTALDEFKPILGYAELGPLFQETAIVPESLEVEGDEHYLAQTAPLLPAMETPLARHIRFRAGVTDPLVEGLHTAMQHMRRTKGYPYANLLFSWSGLVTAKGDPGFPVDGQGLLTLIANSNGELISPAQWDWSAVARELSKIPKGGELYGDITDASRNMRRIAGAFLEQIPTGAEALDPTGLPATSPARSVMYVEMLIDAIYKLRLAPFSQSVAEIWQAIRAGSAVRFDGLTLHQAHRERGFPALSASLELTVDGIQGAERGVLSQGELHTLALSVFLPTMMRPESPFRFAVIDDPVQVMDAHAVDGLAQVLEKAADDLQVIVFTHDERLPKALRSLEIDHTLINVTRSGRSVVECEVVSDPVTQRLADARAEAERPAFDDEFGRRQDVADQCRRAIEAACIRAIRRKLGRLSWEPREIEDEVDWAISGQTNSTRHLMALAIFGERERIADVANYVTENKSWGRRVHRTLSRVNELVHASDADSARAAYAGDLFRLIDDVEYVTNAIEANCA